MPNPVFGGRGGWHFPPLFLLGGWLAGGRHWHFAAMWLFSMNLLGYGIYIFGPAAGNIGLLTLGSKGPPKKSKNEKRKNYALHRIIYTLIIPVLLLALVTGLAMYKPAQLHWISGLFGSWQILRVFHFITIPIVVVIYFLSLLLGFKVGNIRLLQSMFF